MTLAFAALFVVAVLAALYRAARRAITIAELVIDRGSVRVARGGLAAGVLSDLADVASRPPAIRHATVIIARSSGRAEVHLRGEVAAEKAQQLRNVIGGVPLAKLANARHRR